MNAELLGDTLANKSIFIHLVTGQFASTCEVHICGIHYIHCKSFLFICEYLLLLVRDDDGESQSLNCKQNTESGQRSGHFTSIDRSRVEKECWMQ